MVKAIPDHPEVNAHFDDEAGIIRRYAGVHGGVATQTRRGLLVPVIRNAEAFELHAIANEIGRLSESARAGKATREELSGSTITVSSLGPLGGHRRDADRQAARGSPSSASTKSSSGRWCATGKS